MQQLRLQRGVADRSKPIIAVTVAVNLAWQATVEAQKLEKSVAFSSCFLCFLLILGFLGPPGAIFEAGTQKRGQKYEKYKKDHPHCGANFDNFRIFFRVYF